MVIITFFIMLMMIKAMMIHCDVIETFGVGGSIAHCDVETILAVEVQFEFSAVISERKQRADAPSTGVIFCGACYHNAVS